MKGVVVLIASRASYNAIRLRLELDGAQQVWPSSRVDAGVELAFSVDPERVVIDSALKWAPETVDYLREGGLPAEMVVAPNLDSPPPRQIDLLGSAAPAFDTGD